MNLRAWLRKDPKPSKLRVDGKDVAIVDGKWKWAEAERSIVALEGDKIEALDSSGGVLRACMLGEDGEPDESKATTPKESELVLIARELRIAAQEARADNSEAYRYAFDAVVNMFNAQSARLGGLESAWQKLVLQAGTNEEDSITQLLASSVLAGKRDAAAEANGKKK